MTADSHAPLLASGGKAVYGVSLGILMLEAQFPRIPGDMGNAGTWPFPVLYRVVPGASPDRVVRHLSEDLLPDFIDAAKELVSWGVSGITTNCGFLALFQAQLSAACQVPVLSSSLLQARMIQQLLPPGRKVGIITVSKADLSPAHLAAAKVPADVPIVGTENGREFTRVLLNNELTLNVDKAREDILDAAAQLIEAHPEVGALLLECTNMSPYSRDLQHAFNLPVFDIFTCTQWFHSALLPRRFALPG